MNLIEVPLSIATTKSCGPQRKKMFWVGNDDNVLFLKTVTQTSGYFHLTPQSNLDHRVIDHYINVLVEYKGYKTIYIENVYIESCFEYVRLLDKLSS